MRYKAINLGTFGKIVLWGRFFRVGGGDAELELEGGVPGGGEVYGVRHMLSREKCDMEGNSGWCKLLKDQGEIVVTGENGVAARLTSGEGNRLNWVWE